MSEDHTEKTVMPDIARHLLDTVPVSPLSLRIIDYNQPEWLAEFNLRGERIAELEKEKSELLAKCEKYECEIGLAKQQIAALESKSNMYIDLSVAMASTARKVDGLEKERDQLRKALRGLMQAVDGCLTPHEALLWKKCEEAMRRSEIGQRGGKTHWLVFMKGAENDQV